MAQPAAGPAVPRSASGKVAQRDVIDWLQRLRRGSRVPAFTGTFVVSPVGGALSSARIWHICEGPAQIERVEALSGMPRVTFLRDDEVVTYLPQLRVVKFTERVDSGDFPHRFGSEQSGAAVAAAGFYQAREGGQERVAGLVADVVEITPRDGARFGYRVWSERRTGLAIKTQTLDAAGQILEQSAFSDLQLDAPLKISELSQMMDATAGYRVIKDERVRTTPEAEGWQLKEPVAGFATQGCFRRAFGPSRSVVQWIFSDGLATVSLFLEPFNSERHQREGLSAVGATHTLARRVPGAGGSWWVTAMGEVPAATLRQFVSGLARRD